MKVNECMCENVICAAPDTTVSEIAKLMSEKHVGCIPICEYNKQIVGIVTDRDIALRSVACGKDANTTKASEIMTTDVYKVTTNSDVTDATKLMCDCQVRRIPVTNGNTVIGIITLADLVNNKNISDEQLTTTVEGICNCNNNQQNWM